jgi:hypothetical protein
MRLIKPLRSSTILPPVQIDEFCGEILDDVLLGVKEDEIVGRKCLDYGSPRGVCVHVYLLLVLLSVLTQMWTDIVAEGDDVAKKRIGRVFSFAGIRHVTYLGKYFVIQGGALPHYLLFL